MTEPQQSPTVPTLALRVAGAAASSLRRFLQANRRLSARFDRRDDARLYGRYDTYVGQALSALPPGAVVADVGGGRRCSFAEALPDDHALAVVAIDVSPEELSANSTAD
ncbi:MAG: hypothetical protein M3N47_01100, partial [Chloroflexota bacterium]|nr:hypothetical protein [Chloroflexota bacterium]